MARFRVLRGFAGADECARLVTRASGVDAWIEGRQETGYQKFALVGLQDPVAARAVAELGQPAAWDCYLLRYLTGSYVPPHVDPPLESGMIHVRLNLLIGQHGGGGTLRIDGQDIGLAVGDAVVFRPDACQHEVTVVDGVRLVFSVGCNLPGAG